MSSVGKKLMMTTAAMFAGGLLYAAPASAQATRTWISGVGDDANPCSRTAPCKTFAGAISKTAGGGEINCLDPGGFGGVTVVKAMTFLCDFTEGGVLVSGTNGFTINAGDTDVVTISGIDIFGPTASPGLSGVRLVNGAGVNIRNSTIKGFNTSGVSIEPGAGKTAFLNMDNVIVIGNGTNGDGTTGGIRVIPASGGTANVVLNNVRASGNLNSALRLDVTSTTGSAVNATVINSQFTNSGIGALVKAPAATGTITATVVGSVFSGNGSLGVLGNGAGVTARFSGNTISGNGFASAGTAAGVSGINGAAVLSMSNNLLQGNVNNAAVASNGAFTGTFLPN